MSAHLGADGPAPLAAASSMLQGAVQRGLLAPVDDWVCKIDSGHPEVTLQVVRETSDGRVVVIAIEVGEKCRGRGLGTMCMRRLCAVADRHDDVLAVGPEPRPGSRSLEDTMRFCRRFGFERDQCAGTDILLRIPMSHWAVDVTEALRLRRLLVGDTAYRQARMRGDSAAAWQIEARIQDARLREYTVRMATEDFRRSHLLPVSERW